MVGSFSVQPSEFLKLAVVIFAADLLMRREEVLNDVRRSLRPIILLAALAAGACLLQGDLGSAIVMCSIVLAVAFIGGVPLSPMLATGVVTAVGARRLRLLQRVPLQPLHGLPRHHRAPRRALVPDVPGLPVDRRRRADRLRRRRRQRQARLPAARPQRLHLRRHRRRARASSARSPSSAGSCCSSGSASRPPLAAPDRFGMLLAGGIAAVVRRAGRHQPRRRDRPDAGDRLTLPFFSAGGSSLFVSMTAAGLLLNVARRAMTVMAFPGPAIGVPGTQAVAARSLALARSHRGRRACVP